jgi:hypothetical protein
MCARFHEEGDTAECREMNKEFAETAAEFLYCQQNIIVGQQHEIYTHVAKYVKAMNM